MGSKKDLNIVFTLLESLDAGHLHENLFHFLDFALGQTGTDEYIPQEPESP
jgi:hypothetical protein